MCDIKKVDFFYYEKDILNENKIKILNFYTSINPTPRNT